MGARRGGRRAAGLAVLVALLLVVAFVAGVSDDQGYGWAIARALAAAGASVCVGTWPPVLAMGELACTLAAHQHQMLSWYQSEVH